MYQTISDGMLKAYYRAVQAADTIGLLQRTHEDGSFGVDVAKVGAVNVSRDLLDSVTEMLFLHKAFLYRPGGLGALSVLDVGGGYGRLTKRWRDAWPHGKYHVTDGMAMSTFLATKYLNHYHYGQSVVPLPELHGFLARTKVDLLVNTHSFPEMAAEDVEFWLRTARAHHISYIFIVPNGGLKAETGLTTNRGESITALLAKHGYHLMLFENFFVHSLGLCWKPTAGQPFDSRGCERPEFFASAGSFTYGVPYYLFKLLEPAKWVGVCEHR